MKPKYPTQKTQQLLTNNNKINNLYIIQITKVIDKTITQKPRKRYLNGKFVKI